MVQANATLEKEGNNRKMQILAFAWDVIQE
jgi:hypothetical protein